MFIIIKKLLSKLNEAHKDNDGNLSWVRIISSLIIVTILSMYSYRTIKFKEYDFKNGEVATIALVVAGKVAQKKFENDASKDKMVNDKDDDKDEENRYNNK